jgi:thiazole synthase
MQDTLSLYDHSFSSRILLGTARYESPTQLVESIKAADPAMVTVALRKQVHSGSHAGQSFWDILRTARRPLLPNTAGCYTAKDAINTALITREVFETDMLKLEVIGDDQNLQPDPFGLVEAATELVKQGFRVLPYCTDDLVLCRRLLDAGCEVLMPWAAPIGTGQGPRNPKALRELRERFPDVPLIVDAGLGLPSHACQVMEWGFDGILVNTAVSRAIDPVRMATAFANATKAGRLGYLAGPIPVQDLAVASTPEIGTPFWTEVPQSQL